MNTAPLLPHIPKGTLKLLQRISDTADRGDSIRPVYRLLRKRAQLLLNTFQARIRKPVWFVTCNGGWWLTTPPPELDSVPYRELCGVLDDIANPLAPGSFEPRGNPDHKRVQERYMRAFPELIELWWIAYELDALPNRAGLPEIKPIRKPRRSICRR